MKKVGIIGCGWLGSKIAEHFAGKYEIYTTTSSSHKIEKLISQGFNPTLIKFTDDPPIEDYETWKVLSNLESIIITVPFSDKSFSINRFEHLFSFMGDYKGQLFFMSSTGVYPQTDKVFSESDLSSDSVLSERMIKEKYPQVNILRLAGLMGDDRLLYKYNVTNLNYAVNHIHYLDICLLIEKMLERKLNSKLYNVTAPLHPSKMEVINAQKNVEAEKSEVKGKIISPSKMISELDFVFQFPDPRNFHR